MVSKGQVLAGAAAIIAIAAAASVGGAGFVAGVVVWLAVNALIAASFRFVQLIGELNFAIAGFVGVGAYGAGVATAIFQLPFMVALGIGAVLAVLVSVVFGFVTLRAKGPYFMLISFAFTEVLRMIYTQVDAIGGNSGLIGIVAPNIVQSYYAAFAVFVVVVLLFGLYAIEKSDFGKILVAIRNNDAIVEASGINVLNTKVVCLAISAVAAGIAGALLAYSNTVISPNDFSFFLAVYALAYVKVGGEGSLLGAIVGAIVLTVLAQFALSLGHFEHIFYGAAIVLSVLLLPKGLVSLPEALGFGGDRGASGRPAQARMRGAE